ncbi:hypothetical protein EDB89DRAFT_1906974 [Lactarius sanguifluus]|nr:hypothetical protein EDB89DRAFT_1906974 [Lactarius sanguifluus]
MPSSSLIDPQEDPVTIAENQVAAMLDKLESIGALKRSNRMELEEVINPPEEAYPYNITDPDVFDAAMKEEEEYDDDEDDDDEDNDDDDVDVDTDTPVEPRPTRAEAIQAALTIIRYVKDKDGAYFREVESTLTSFRWAYISRWEVAVVRPTEDTPTFHEWMNSLRRMEYTRYGRSEKERKDLFPRGRTTESELAVIIVNHPRSAVSSSLNGNEPFLHPAATPINARVQL